MRKSRLRRSKCAGFGSEVRREALLYFNAEQSGLENHLRRVDLRDGEPCRVAFAVDELEDVVGRAVGLREAHVGVDVREREVRVLLRERVEVLTPNSLPIDFSDLLSLSPDSRLARLTRSRCFFPFTISVFLC